MKRAAVTTTITITIAALAVTALAGCGSSDSPASHVTSPPKPSGQSVEETLADRVIVPDVVGMSPEEAVTALKAAGLAVIAEGEGDEVANQFPARGTSVDEGTEVTLGLASTAPAGTRDDPFPAGTTLVGTGSTGADEVTFLLGAAVWGADAQIMAENQFNDPAPEGSTYVLVPVTITNVASEEAVVPWLAVTVSYVAPDGRSYDEASAVIPGELSDIGDLYVGGSATGNLAFVLPTAAQGGVWAVAYGWSDPVFVAAG